MHGPIEFVMRRPGSARSLALVLCALAGLSGPAIAEDAMQTVKLAKVSAGNVEIKRVFFGKVVARQTVDLAFQVGGQIFRLPIEEGATVAKDDVIAQLDLEPFKLALTQAQANAEQAKRNVDRYEQLAGSTVAQTSLEDARTALTLANVALRSAERDLRHATLHAPFDAIVATRLMPSFSTTSAGTPVVRLHDMSELRIEIDVPETMFQRASRDAKVAMLATFPSSDTEYPLEVREFNAETADIGQTYSITLGMPVPDDITVLPGSSAQVSVTLRTGATNIEVPMPAIVVGNDKQTHVMVFEPTGADHGTVTRVPAEIATTERGTVRVISGLKDGQEIVVSGASQLKTGAKVRRFTGFGD